MDFRRPLAVVTPTLDGDVLAVLARVDSSFTTGQVHRLLGAYSVDGVRKVLVRLSGQGIVTATRHGGTTVYALNRQHLASGPVVALAALRSELLERLGELMSSWVQPPVYAAVFGSAARGEASATSDLDLLVVRRHDEDDDVWDAQVAELAGRATAWTGNDARPTVVDERQVLTDGSPTRLLADVLQDGLTVFGDRAWLVRATRRAV